MEYHEYNNISALITGISMVFVCCLVSYLFQRYLFSKYKNRAKNTMKKDGSQI